MVNHSPDFASGTDVHGCVTEIGVPRSLPQELHGESFHWSRFLGQCFSKGESSSNSPVKLGNMSFSSISSRESRFLPFVMLRRDALRVRRPSSKGTTEMVLSGIRTTDVFDLTQSIRRCELAGECPILYQRHLTIFRGRE